MSEKNNLKSKIESILFVANGPLKISKIAHSLGKSKEEIKKAIDDLSSEYKERGAGICLVFNEEMVEMSSIPDNFKEVKKFLSKFLVEELTPAALEALSIIAYRGPVSEEMVSTIRGINSQIILRHLLSRDLIIEKGDPPQYEVSTKLLRQLGLENPQQMPNYQKYHNLEIEKKNEE